MPKHNHTTTALEAVSLSPDTAAELSGISTRQIYRLLERGAFKARRCGARTLIDAQSWRNYFSALPEYTSGVMTPNHPANQRRKPANKKRRAR